MSAMTREANTWKRGEEDRGHGQGPMMVSIQYNKEREEMKKKRVLLPFALPPARA
jgi:hypothetical protein